MEAADEFKGLHGDFLNARLFIATAKGALYYRAAGDIWTRVPSSGQQKEGETVVAFQCIAGPVDAGQSIYLAGSDGFGYYALTVGTPPTLSRFDKNTLGLYTATVRRILVDVNLGERTIFAGTAGDGLWRAFFTSGGVPEADSKRSWNPE